ncbi:MAG: DUF4190 domain-containing protein [Acidimicrobiales bacterium]
MPTIDDLGGDATTPGAPGPSADDPTLVQPPGGTWAAPGADPTAVQDVGGPASAVPPLGLPPGPNQPGGFAAAPRPPQLRPPVPPAVPPPGYGPPGGYGPGAYGGAGYGPPPSAGPPPGYGAPSPYGPTPGYGPGWGGGAPLAQIDHPQGTTVLVLGLLGIFCCGLLAPFAWVQGNGAIREIDRNPVRYRNRGTVQAGRILGIIGTGILALNILAFVVVALAGGLSSSSSSSSGRSDFPFGSTASTEQCKTDTKTLKTVMLAWNTEYLTGDDPSYDTPWPRSEADMVRQQLLQEESDLHDVQGDGARPPTIFKAPGQCSAEEIVQLN